MTVEELRAERQAVRDRLSRCTDLFGRMLLTGKLHRLHREEEELTRVTKDQDDG